MTKAALIARFDDLILESKSLAQEVEQTEKMSAAPYSKLLAST